MCLCRKFATQASRYRWTMLSEVAITVFFVIYYLKIALLIVPFEDLPWNFHSYVGVQVALFLAIMAVRRREIKYLLQHERDNDIADLINWRVLLFDFIRSLCFTVDVPLTFALFRAQQFF